jgi:hypothetical protein
MDTQKKLFAFRLADKQTRNAGESEGKWKARDGIAIAGCCQSTIPDGHLWLVASFGDTGNPCP